MQTYMNKVTTVDTKAKTNIIDILVFLIVTLRFCYPLNALFGGQLGYTLFYGLYLLFLMFSTFNIKSYLFKFLKETIVLILLLLVVILRSLLASRINFGFYEPLNMAIMITNMIIAYINLRN